MRLSTRTFIAPLIAVALSGSVHAAGLDTMKPDEIEALQHRLADAGCYKGAIDGQTSGALTDAVKACPDQAPVLRIETGMHTTQIWRIGVDAFCRIAATASDDKTVRIWSMPDGRLLRTQRLPIAAGNGGQARTAAVSPDGRLVAAGGWDATFERTGKNSVYVFDAATGDNVRRIGNFDNVISHIAFSADGRRLAVALNGKEGIRVLDVTSGEQLMYDKDFTDASYGIAFGPDGALYAAGFDGFVRRYGPDLRRTAKVATKVNRQPYGISVDPSGQRLAVGFNANAGVEIYDARSLKRLATTDAHGITDGDFAAVAWSRDGQRLYGGGAYDVQVDGAWRYVIRSFTRDGKRLADAPISTNTYQDLNRCGDSMVFAASDPSFGLLQPDGMAVTLQTGHTADVRGSRDDAFTASADATKVRFGLGQSGVNPVRFDLVTGGLTDAPEAMAGAVKPEITGLDVQNWKNSLTPQFNGQKIALDNYEVSRSLAIRPAQDGFVLGTEWSLRSFDASGKQRWNQPVPSIAWGVNLTRGGDVIVAAYGDGTVRWHRWSDGQELLALFVNKDTKAWVAWTPTGYYMASPGAEDMIGWHINRGWEQAADFFPASRFRDKFSRPDIVRLVLDTLDEDEAVKQANAASKRRDDEKALIERLPPVVTILSPSSGSDVPQGMVEIRYKTRSPSGAKVDRVEALVDGAKIEARGLTRVEPAASGSEAGTGVITLPMPPHDAVISLVAYADGQASDAARVELKGTPAAGRSLGADDDSLKPTLYALLIGVAHYQNKSFDLAYSDEDANGLAAALKAQKGKLYKDVEVKVLTDQEATATAIKRGLTWLRKQTTARDLAIVFAAGHGTTDAKGKFWFLPYDVDGDDVAATAVSRDDISDVLFDLPGKKLLFLDACHSGAALNAGARGGTDIGTAVNDFAQAEGGVVAYAAATGREFSFERPEWGHGAFTKALIEGLEGKGDVMHKGVVTTAGLDLFLETRVKELTGGQQHPVMSRPKTVPDFPIALAQ